MVQQIFPRTTHHQKFQEHKMSYPLNTEDKLEQQSHAKPLSLSTINTKIWSTFLWSRFWPNTLNSNIPFFSEINYLSDPNHKETVSFQETTFEYQMPLLLEILHQGPSEPNSTYLTAPLADQRACP